MKKHEIADVKGFDQSYEVREFPKGKLKLLNIGGFIIGEGVFEPGWKWSESVQPLVQTHSCEAPHFQYHVSGTMVVRMDDETEHTCRPGDVSYFPSGHDAWTEGDVPCVVVDFYGMSEYANELEAVVAKHAEERKNTEEELRIAAIAFESQEGMCVMNNDLIVLKVNNSFSEITGYSAKQCLGQPLHIFKSEFHNDDFYKTMWKHVEKNGAWRGEIWHRHINGDKYAAQFTITAVKNEHEDISHYIVSIHDITLRKEAEEKIHRLAFYDALTHLPNRRMLNDRLSHVMEMSKRSGRYAALMFMDMDKFKTLNDTYGHVAGDLLLVEVANRILSCVRKMDTVARFGGDEFVVLIHEITEDINTSMERLLIIAEKIRAELSKPYFLKVGEGNNTGDTVEHHCSTSIGTKLFIGDDVSLVDVVKEADMAMYRAKELGRNRIESN